MKWPAARTAAVGWCWSRSWSSWFTRHARLTRRRLLIISELSLITQETLHNCDYAVVLNMFWPLFFLLTWGVFHFFFTTLTILQTTYLLSVIHKLRMYLLQCCALCVVVCYVRCVRMAGALAGEGVDEEGPETVVVATGNDVIVRSYRTPAISNISYWSHTLRYNEVQL